jgi:hypothetical protein|tara:strand:- start:122 stop:1294 length:1173 start_codon:yes stop_codon:yes gene_type:complete
MASNTRVGATKPGPKGTRLRWNGKKWVQIKATGSGGNTTSSRNRAARQNRSNANVSSSNRESRSTAITRTNNSSLAVRGGQVANTGSIGPRGMRPRLSPAQNVFSEALQRQLQSGQRGGDLTTNQSPRRTNVNTNPSSGRTQMGTRGGGVRQQAQLPSFYDRIAKELQRAKNASARAADRNNPFRSSARGATGPAKFGGAREAAITQGALALLGPLARQLGYSSAYQLRIALGGGKPRLDVDGNPIIPRPTPGVDAPGAVDGLTDVQGNPLQINYAGPGGAPSGSGQNQEQQSRRGRWTVDGFVMDAPSVPQTTQTTNETPPPPPLLPPPPSNRRAQGSRQRQPKTGANDPRNKAYIEALKALNSTPNPSKKERDKVRNIGLAIHKAIYG